MKEKYFNFKACAKIRTLLRQGFRIDGNPCLLSELEFYDPEIACLDYSHLSDNAQLQLRMLECSVFLEQFPDITEDEISTIQNAAQFGFYTHYAAPYTDIDESDKWEEEYTVFRNTLKRPYKPWLPDDSMKLGNKRSTRSKH